MDEILTKLSREYYNLAKAFALSSSEQLLPYQPFDHKIKLMPG